MNRRTLAIWQLSMLTAIHFTVDMLSGMLPGFLPRLLEKYTLSIGLQMFLTGTQNEWDLLMAASALFTLPLVIIFFLAQKQILGGISTTSGLK